MTDTTEEQRKRDEAACVIDARINVLEEARKKIGEGGPLAPIIAATDKELRDRQFDTGAAGTSIGEATQASAIEKLRSRLIRIDADTLDTEPPPRKWLIADVLLLGKVGILASAGGVGKTRALVDLAIAVATGGAWYGLPTNNEGRVLLALAEEDEAEVRRRIYYSAKPKNLAIASREALINRISVLPLAGLNAALVGSDGKGEIHETKMLEAFRTILHDGGEPWRLIVLDPLSRFAGADTEKDANAATRFIEAAESLSLATGATVLMAHHTTKEARKEGNTTGVGIRGSTGLHDAIRWAATLDADEGGIDGLVRFAVAKSNYSEKGEPIYLRMEKHGVLRRIEKDEHARLISERDRELAAAKAAAKAANAMDSGAANASKASSKPLKDD